MSKINKGVLALFLAAVIWGALPLFPRFLSTGFALFQQIYLRLIFAILFITLVFYRDINFSKFKKISARDWLLLIFRGAAYYLIGLGLYTKAILITKISNVIFIGAIPMTAMLGFILLKEKATPQKVALVFLSFLGVLIISAPDISHLFNWGWGETLSLITTVFFSLALVARKWHTNYLNDKEITLLMFCFGFLWVFLTSLIIGEGLPVTNWNLGLVVVLILAGLSNTSSAYFFNYGLARVSAVLSGNILSLEPVFATIFAFWIFKEIPAGKEFVGAFLIIAAAYFMNNLEKKSFITKADTLKK